MCKLEKKKGEKAYYRQYDIRSGLIIPLQMIDNILGALSLSATGTSIQWSTHVIRRVETMARLITAALDKNHLEKAKQEADAIYRTERMRMEKLLRESEEKFRIISETAVVGIYIIQDEKLIYVNPALANMFGYDSREIEGKLTPRQLMHPDEIEIVMDRLSQRLNGVVAVEAISYRALKKDGSQIHVEAFTSLAEYLGKPAVMGTVVDITDRKHAENATLSQDIDEQKRTQERLEEYQANLRTLASRLTVAEEQERRRIASGLHDSAAQDLVGAAMRLRQLVEIAGDKHEFKEALIDIQTLIHRTSRELRTLSLDLSPPLLFKVGLEAAIDAYARRFIKDHQISCNILDDRQPKPLGNDARSLLYRCTCELMVNVAKHSKANTVRIEIQRVDDEVVISVTDNGKGYDASKLSANLEAESGFGLFSVQERLRPLGGHMQVESEVGRGTRVTLRLPIETEQEKEEQQST